MLARYYVIGVGRAYRPEHRLLQYRPVIDEAIDFASVPPGRLRRGDISPDCQRTGRFAFDFHKRSSEARDFHRHAPQPDGGKSQNDVVEYVQAGVQKVARVEEGERFVAERRKGCERTEQTDRQEEPRVGCKRAVDGDQLHQRTQEEASGYIDRQRDEIERHRRHEETAVPQDFDYAQVRGLSAEVCEKLVRIRPATVGQAARISGVTPAAISLLLVHLKKRAGDSRKSA